MEPKKRPIKVLILVLSYNDGGIFTDFMRCSQKTWDIEFDPNCAVKYYYGGGLGFVSTNELSVECSDDYEMMHWKFKLALDRAWYHSYDLIFRTNSCSYIVKEKLLKVAESLPRTNCYAGYQNIDYISGAGIFFSPDVLDILVNELTPEPHGAEDVLIGRILRDRVPMINDNSRIDADLNGFNSFDGYHFRAKTSNDLSDRQRDIDAIYELHKKLTGK